MSELTPEQERDVDWLVKYAKPTPSREDAIEAVRASSTDLYDKLSRENFAETGSDYGYGGEIVDTVETNHFELYKWIVERETEILGMPLEEFAKRDWRLE